MNSKKDCTLGICVIFVIYEFTGWKVGYKYYELIGEG